MCGVLRYCTNCVYENDGMNEPFTVESQLSHLRPVACLHYPSV